MARRITLADRNNAVYNGPRGGRNTSYRINQRRTTQVMGRDRFGNDRMYNVQVANKTAVSSDPD